MPRIIPVGLVLAAGLFFASVPAAAGPSLAAAGMANAANPALVPAKHMRPPRTFFRIPGKHHRQRRAKNRCPENAVWNGEACMRLKRR